MCVFARRGSGVFALRVRKNPSSPGARYTRRAPGGAVSLMPPDADASGDAGRLTELHGHLAAVAVTLVPPRHPASPVHRRVAVATRSVATALPECLAVGAAAQCHADPAERL